MSQKERKNRTSVLMFKSLCCRRGYNTRLTKGQLETMIDNDTQFSPFHYHNLSREGKSGLQKAVEASKRHDEL